jgi:hypothetical protein
MGRSRVLFAALLLSSCSSSATESMPGPDPDVTIGSIPGCYAVVLGGRPADDVSLPTLVELTRDPARGFVDPGRLAVREPGTSEPQSPLSWWAPGSAGTLQLVLGGGFTGYSFFLRSARGGSWSGEGTYFADFGIEPEPAPLPVRLTTRSCP